MTVIIKSGARRAGTIRRGGGAMSRGKVVVLGDNFGGLTATLSVHDELHGDGAVTVLSASDHFVWNPSLIWLHSAKRSPDDITFPLAPHAVGVPKTGSPTEALARTAARNIAAQIVPGPQTPPMKVALGKYFMWKAREGHVSLA